MSFFSSSEHTKMKPSREKLPFSIIIIILISFFIFICVLYTDEARTLSSTIFKLKFCSKPKTIANSRDPTCKKADQDDPDMDDKDEFDPNECNISEGKWVFNNSTEPLYTDQTCPYLDIQVTCVNNGRPDSDYMYWEWQPDECILPRFDPEVALEKLRGKRLLFVGDSLQRGQWQSFVCLVDSKIPEGRKSMRRGSSHSVFKAKDYDASIEYYWAPFIVNSNSDVKIIGDPKQRILKVDSVSKHEKNWLGVDILVFNSYIWWMNGIKIKSLWGSFANREEGFLELDAAVTYKIALKTWANWVDSTINPNKTRIFFTTISPTHMRNSDWHNEKGIRCYNETKPILEKGYWGSGSDKRMMEAVNSIVGKMKVPVTLINITQISEYRIDGHTSVYTERQGKVLTEEQKADPKRYADCIHWCLPGVPDTWNQLFLAYL